MKVLFGHSIDNIQELCPPYQNYQILPEDSLILTGIFAEHKNFDTTLSELDRLIKHISTDAKYIFLDASADPVFFTNHELQALVELLNKYYQNKICKLLVGNCQYYLEQTAEIFWYPYWLLCKQHDHAPIKRNKRIGCLNRKNSPHRLWLMHNLLSKQLVDHDRDIYSVAFKNIYSGQSGCINSWMPNLDPQIQNQISNYPAQIATIDDGFINDHSLAHPAWATALAVVTETQVGEYSMITEKTCKAIASKSCWISYTGKASLDVLNTLGFSSNTFDNHATEFDIDPIIQVCQEFDTESRALDYYYSKLSIINHNYDWFRSNSWTTVYQHKLQSWLE